MTLQNIKTDYQSYKVTIERSWFNSEPIIRYTLNTSPEQAISEVCNWFGIAANDGRTLARAEINRQ